MGAAELVTDTEAEAEALEVMVWEKVEEAV